MNARRSPGTVRGGLRGVRDLSLAGRALRRATLVAALLLAVAAGPAVAQDPPFPGVPDPGGDPTVPAPVPPPAVKYFGFNEHSYLLGTHGWSAQDIASVAAGAGATTARFNITWWTVEPTRDHWSEAGWQAYYRQYEAYLARGIRPVLTLQGTPRWAVRTLYSGCGHRRGCEFPPAEWADDQWQEFAAEVARRFPYAAAIEIWNEPNLQGFFKPSPNPWRYASMLRQAAIAIKTVHPTMTVLGGALAAHQEHSLDRWEMVRFLSTMYEAEPSIKHLMDGLSFHPIRQSMDLGAGSLYAKFFHDVRSTAARFGDAGVPLWLTEIGVTTTGQDRFSLADQADALIAQYRKSIQMPDVKAVIIHLLADQVGFPSSDPSRGFGVIAGWSPFTPKPAYCAFAGRVPTPDPYGPCPRIVEEVPDTYPPDTAITFGPPASTTEDAALFFYSATEENVTFECRLDAGAFAPCHNNGKLYQGLGTGAHTFRVRATDEAGNIDPTPAVHTWTVEEKDDPGPDPGDPDTTPPDTTISYGPPALTTDDAALFFYSASEEDATFECKLDGNAFVPCDKHGQLYEHLGIGSHTFQVRATDPAGNTDPTPAVHTWTVEHSGDPGDPGGEDTTPPETAIDHAPPAVTTDDAALFFYSSSEPGSTFECKLDANPYAPCDKHGQLYEQLGAGQHTFRVRATDEAGNTDPTPAVHTWTVEPKPDPDPDDPGGPGDPGDPDTTPPDTTISYGPPDSTELDSALFFYTSSEPESTFECSLDASPFAPCDAYGQLYEQLGAGRHTFRVRATDEAGNTDPTPASHTWTVTPGSDPQDPGDPGDPDTSPPDTSIDYAPPASSDSAAALFFYSSSEPGSTFECKLGDDPFEPCHEFGQLYEDLAPGTHIFQVRATDAAGNTDPTPAAHSWTVKEAQDPGGPGGPGDPGDPGNPGDPGDPGGPPLDPDVSGSRCSVRMVTLRWLITQTSQSTRIAHRRKYNRVARRCIPGARQAKRLQRRIRRAKAPVKRARLRARKARVKARCAPCRREIRRIERRALRKTGAAFNAALAEHKEARKACRARKKR